jgi:DNA ligase D-like protein (predicted 3'-phosphoesterase)
MTRSKFIVVEHDAKKARLHWDLRFEMPKNKSIWMSFAVRKGIPLEPGQKVLAVRTHDHTKEEALFLGTIKQGYGEGKLKKWDDGQVLIHKFKPGHILLEFKGRKVKGFYHLINTGVMKKQQKFKQQQYMLFKGKSLNEWSGMVSRIPGTGRGDEVEEDYGNQTGPKLPWSKRKTTV